MEHGNAARPPGSRRADLTARRVKGSSIGTTEKANASGNAPDTPTSVTVSPGKRTSRTIVKREKQMTVPPGTDASLHRPRLWKAIPWKALHQQVRRLQVRIAKAIPLVGTCRRVPATMSTGLKRLEPYEGKLSSTVLRGGWAGNSPPPLDCSA